MAKKHIYVALSIVFIFLILFSGMASIWAENVSDLENLTTTEGVTGVLKASDNTSELVLLETPETFIASENELKKAKIKDSDKIDKKLKKKLEKQLDVEMGVASLDEDDELYARFLVYADSKTNAKKLGKNVDEVALVEDLDMEGILALVDNNDVEFIMEEPVLNVSNTDVVQIINSTETNLLTVGGVSLDGTDSAVCLIDTGVDYNHEDLAGSIINAYDYVNNDNDAMDDNGHGTHIAGTILAIAPNAKIISVKVCNAAGGCGGFDMIQGVQWCMDHKDEYNLKSISISIGDYAGWTDATCPTWMDGTLEWAHDENILSAAASGNEGFTSGINYPACSPYTISVGATTKSDVIGVPTNRGANLDLLAPGAMIVSTCLGGGTCMKSGTSMATPSVAASAAILKKYYEDNSIIKTPDELKQLLKDTALDILGYKRMNLLYAVEEDGLYDGNEPPISCDNLSNIISYWSFDVGEGTDDLGVNNGTIYGATLTTGKNDGALSFDGDDDYVEIADNPSLDMSSEITLESWVYPEAYSGWGMGIIDKSSFDGAGGNYRLNINYIENRAYFRIKIKGLIIDKDITSTDAIPLNEWTHIAATYDGSSMKIYINGELDTEKAQTGEMVIDNYNVRLGQYLGSNRFFQGKIDEVAIFSRALNLTEINDSYINGVDNKKICVAGEGSVITEISENDKIDEPLQDLMVNMVVGVAEENSSDRVLVIANDVQFFEGVDVLESSGEYAVINLNDVNKILSLANTLGVEFIMEEPILNASNIDVINIINSEDVNPLAVEGVNLEGAGTSVCLIDTGVDYNHEDLAGKIINGPDFVNNDADSMDDNGHGTHIAGTILAIAPETKVIAVKVCNAAGGCGGFDMIQGAQWCADNKDTYDVKSLSISIGDYAEWTDASCPTWMDGTLEYVADEDIFSAAASGNEGFTSGINYPACSPYVTSVGATTKSDVIGVPTNRGANLDLLAPGAMIVSTCLGGGTCMKSGTSMATPVVAASATILKQYYELASVVKTNAEIEQLMKDTALDILGYKRVDLKAAVDVDELYGNVSAMCGLVLTENTTLTEDLNCVGDDKDYALSINTSGVVLDCDGHTITGDSKYGIFGYKRNTILDNVEIKNCKLQGFETGIRVQNFNESTILNNNVSATLHAILITGPVDYSVVTVKNNTVTGESGIGLYFHRVKDSLIEDNFVDGGTNGMYMSGFTNNLVKNNDILGTGGSGMHIKPGNYNTFVGNNVSDGNLGIRLFYQGGDSSDGNVFDGNIITNNKWMGLWLYTAHAQADPVVNNTTIINNYIAGNNYIGHGGWYNAAVKVVATNTLIENNTIKDNKVGECILLYGGNSGGGIVRNNTITNCTGESGSGIRVRDGSTGDVIENNTISDSVRGVYIWQGSETVIRNNEIFGMSFSAIPLSSNVGVGFEIYGNNIYDNQWGIYFSRINHVDVHDNLIIDNDKAGIMYRGILDPAVYDDLKVYNNNIYNNTVVQIRDDGVWGAREMSYNNQGNYWGHDAGACFVAENDSNRGWVTDSHCYLSISGWDLGGSSIPEPTVYHRNGGGSSKLEPVPESLDIVETPAYEVVEVPSSSFGGGIATGHASFTVEDEILVGEDIIVEDEKDYFSSMTAGVIGSVREGLNFDWLVEFFKNLFS